MRPSQESALHWYTEVMSEEATERYKKNHCLGAVGFAVRLARDEAEV